MPLKSASCGETTENSKVPSDCKTNGQFVKKEETIYHPLLLVNAKACKASRHRIKTSGHLRVYLDVIMLHMYTQLDRRRALNSGVRSGVFLIFFELHQAFVADLELFL